MSEDTPRTLGKYEILKQVGEGGFATVYKARDTTLERIVALKVLRRELLHDPVFVERFKAEAKMAAQLEHPNIVPIYEVGEFQGVHYLAMQYVEGQTLTQILKVRGQLTIQQALKIIGDVAAALDEAHRKGMIHRDIKPSNILIRNDGTVMISDFGLAKAVAASFAASLTSTGQIMGTLRYMSPEQAEESAVDHRADLYSLGVVLYEILAGRPPFAGDTAIQMIRAHADAAPPPPSQFNGAITPAIESVILRALAKDPQQRHPSAGQMARALERAITVGAVERTPLPVKREAEPAPRPAPEPKPRRRRWPVVLAGLALVLCVVAAGSIWLLRDTLWPTATPTVVVQATEVVEEPTLAWTTEPPTDVAEQEPNAPALPEDTDTPGPTALPEAHDTPTPTATATPNPTATPTRTATARPAGDVIQAWTIETGVGTVPGGEGQLQIALYYGDGSPIVDKYLEVFLQRQDLAGQWVTDGGRVDSEWTDNTGMAVLDLAPDSYIVGVAFDGYNWGDAADVQGKASIPVEAGRVTRLTVRLNRLVLGFRYGDGTPIRDKYVEIYRQKQDLAGNWVTDGGRAAQEWTDNTGAAIFDLAPGAYIVAASFYGYNWGGAYDTMGDANVIANAGQETILIQDLGLLSVGLLDAGSQPREGVYVAVYKQRKDAGGSWTIDDQVAQEWTDNGGIAVFHLTPGLYVVRLDDHDTFNVPVEAGKITSGNGYDFSVQE